MKVQIPRRPEFLNLIAMPSVFSYVEKEGGDRIAPTSLIVVRLKRVKCLEHGLAHGKY